MPPAPMNEPLMESRSWQIRHSAYGQSNKDFELQCPVLVNFRPLFLAQRVFIGRYPLAGLAHLVRSISASGLLWGPRALGIAPYTSMCLMTRGVVLSRPFQYDSVFLSSSWMEVAIFYAMCRSRYRCIFSLSMPDDVGLEANVLKRLLVKDASSIEHKRWSHHRFVNSSVI